MEIAEWTFCFAGLITATWISIGSWFEGSTAVERFRKVSSKAICPLLTLLSTARFSGRKALP